MITMWLGKTDLFAEDADRMWISHLYSHVNFGIFQTFGSLSNGEFQLIRQTLLNFFQDMHIRVSMCMYDG